MSPRRPDAGAVADAAATGMSVALWAAHDPDLDAVRSPTGDRTFSELNANANRLARALRADGLGPGDAVALVLTNRPAFAEAVQACLRAGLRYTPVNWHLTADEVAYVVDDCEALALIGDARVGDVLTEVVPRCERLVTRLAVGGPIEGFDDYDAVLDAQRPTDLDDPVLGNRMLYTSGTTGRPKGVVRPPRYSTRLEALTDAPRYAAGTGQLNLCTGPLYHGGPLGFSLAMPHANGVGVVLMERWDAAEALALIERHRITHTHMVPTMFHRLLRLPPQVRAGADVSSMQYIVHGAAPCPVETKRAMIDWFGPIIWEYFAATEGSAASCSTEQWLAHPGTVGLPPDPQHVRILDDDGQPCGPGVPGAICIRRVDEMGFAYFKDPDKTARTERGEYFSIGDIGYLDADGYLFVTDRDAEVIISGGVNIYPAEVEAVLLAHPAVRDAAVIGVPDAEWGESVRGVVELEDAADDDDIGQVLVAHCRAHLATFKCPRRVDVTDRLPRLDNGKLYRNELRDRYRQVAAEPPATPTEATP